MIRKIWIFFYSFVFKISVHWHQNEFIWSLFAWSFLQWLKEGFLCLFIPLLDLNFPNEVEVDPEPYPTAEGKPLTWSQAWSNFRNYLIAWVGCYCISHAMLHYKFSHYHIIAYLQYTSHHSPLSRRWTGGTATVKGMEERCNCANFCSQTRWRWSEVSPPQSSDWRKQMC